MHAVRQPLGGGHFLHWLIERPRPYLGSSLVLLLLPAAFSSLVCRSTAGDLGRPSLRKGPCPADGGPHERTCTALAPKLGRACSQGLRGATERSNEMTDGAAVLSCPSSRCAGDAQRSMATLDRVLWRGQQPPSHARGAPSSRQLETLPAAAKRGSTGSGEPG